MPTHSLDLMRFKIDWQVLSRRQQCGTGTHLPAWMTCGASSGWPPTIGATCTILPSMLLHHRTHLHRLVLLSRLAPAVTAAPLSHCQLQSRTSGKVKRTESGDILHCDGMGNCGQLVLIGGDMVRGADTRRSLQHI